MTDRHRFRAQWHEYDAGVFFITLCSHNKKHIFGRISNGTIMYTALGELIKDEIKKLPNRYLDVEVWNSVVMPNHLHLIVAVGTRIFASASAVDNPQNKGCLKPSCHGEPVATFHHNSRLSLIIGAFKAGVTRKARTRKFASLPEGQSYMTQIWQSRFHEHIIKNRESFENIMNYISTNIENWEKDCLF